MLLLSLFGVVGTGTVVSGCFLASGYGMPPAYGVYPETEYPLWADGVGPGAGYQVWDSTFDPYNGTFYIGFSGWWGMGVGGYNSEASATSYGFTNLNKVAKIEFDALDDGAGNSIYIAPLADYSQRQVFELTEESQHFTCDADFTKTEIQEMLKNDATGSTVEADSKILFYIGSADSSINGSVLHIYNIKFTDADGNTVDVQPVE